MLFDRNWRNYTTRPFGSCYTLGLPLSSIGSGRSLQLGLGRDVDDLTRTGIMQLLARFPFDGPGIALECMDLGSIAIVLSLQSINFFAQALVFRTFLLVNHHTVGTEHHMQEQPAC